MQAAVSAPPAGVAYGPELPEDFALQQLFGDLDRAQTPKLESVLMPGPLEPGQVSNHEDGSAGFIIELTDDNHDENALDAAMADSGTGLGLN